MAKYVYTGEQELVFPTLNVTVNAGDVFEAPAGLVAYAVRISSNKKDFGSDEPANSTPVSETTAEQATTADAVVEDGDVLVETSVVFESVDLSAGVADQNE